MEQGPRSRGCDRGADIGASLNCRSNAITSTTAPSDLSARSCCEYSAGRSGARRVSAAGELVRVCRPGGKIGIANWTPESFIGQLFRMLGKYLPPPAGAKSPALWGTRERIEDMFGANARTIAHETRSFVFRYRSAQHFVDVFQTYYGPTHKAFAALDDAKRQALQSDLVALIGSLNRADDGSMVVASEYLETVITKR